MKKDYFNKIFFIFKAETWLHQRAQAEGWSRATKLQSRTASQGLIGIITTKDSAAMVEVC